MSATMQNPVCFRPMPATGTQDRNKLREYDHVICQCGQKSCRDYDLRKP